MPTLLDTFAHLVDSGRSSLQPYLYVTTPYVTTAAYVRTGATTDTIDDPWLWPEPIQSTRVYGTGYATNSQTWLSWAGSMWPTREREVGQSPSANGAAALDVWRHNHQFNVERPDTRQEAIHRRRRQVAAMRTRVAERRARALLLECLDDEQRADYERTESFRLHVGDNVYRITRGIAGNIALIDERGDVRERWCVHTHGVPDHDNVLAQKLMLETNEAAMRNLANIDYYGVPHHSGLAPQPLRRIA